MKRKTINPAPQTPDSKDCEGPGYYFTLARAKVRGAVQFCERMGIDYVKRNVFRTFNVSIRQGHEFLRNESFSHRLHNDPNREKTRGHLHAISVEKLCEIEHIL